ncbi:MAG: hypothetical protein HY294_00305 [Candidatus Rokubacteria bacterium]|nr:hypothetical protein [Candidatus Rokubacteria bacterium]
MVRPVVWRSRPRREGYRWQESQKSHIALVAILVFRGPLATLIGRTRRVGKGGLETFDAQPAQPTEEKKGVEEFFRSFDNPLIVEAETLIVKDLKDRKIESAADPACLPSIPQPPRGRR